MNSQAGRGPDKEKRSTTNGGEQSELSRFFHGAPVSSSNVKPKPLMERSALRAESKLAAPVISYEDAAVVGSAGETGRSSGDDLDMSAVMERYRSGVPPPEVMWRVVTTNYHANQQAQRAAYGVYRLCVELCRRTGIQQFQIGRCWRYVNQLRDRLATLATGVQRMQQEYDERLDRHEATLQQHQEQLERLQRWRVQLDAVADVLVLLMAWWAAGYAGRLVRRTLRLGGSAVRGTALLASGLSALWRRLRGGAAPRLRSTVVARRRGLFSAWLTVQAAQGAAFFLAVSQLRSLCQRLGLHAGQGTLGAYRQLSGDALSRTAGYAAARASQAGRFGWRLVAGDKTIEQEGQAKDDTPPAHDGE